MLAHLHTKGVQFTQATRFLFGGALSSNAQTLIFHLDESRTGL